MSNADTSKPSRSWLIPRIVPLMVGVLLCGGPITWWMWRHSNAFDALRQRREALADRGGD